MSEGLFKLDSCHHTEEFFRNNFLWILSCLTGKLGYCWSSQTFGSFRALYKTPCIPPQLAAPENSFHPSENPFVDRKTNGKVTILLQHHKYCFPHFPYTDWYDNVPFITQPDFYPLIIYQADWSILLSERSDEVSHFYSLLSDADECQCTVHGSRMDYVCVYACMWTHACMCHHEFFSRPYERFLNSWQKPLWQSGVRLFARSKEECAVKLCRVNWPKI